MPDLPNVFNVAAVGASVIGTLGVGWLVAKFASPLKMIKPDSKTAYIVTGYKGAVPHKAQFVVKSAPQAVWKFGMSDPEAVSLQSFTVNVKRMGIHKATDVEDKIKDTFINEKDESLTLKDKIKAEVDVDFYVQVDTEDTVDSSGKVTISGEQKIIMAKRTLGEINKESIERYLLSKADSALRAAAAQMTIDEIQSDREAFLDMVKKNISLSEHGLKVTDAALRDFRQAPRESFNPNDYFDAQGLKLVTLKANESLQAVNESNQNTQTAIAQKTQEQTIARLQITRTQTEAELAQKQEIARLTAEQSKRVAEIEAENSKLANIAKIVAEQETEQRRIQKDQQIGVSTAQRDQEIKVAQEKSTQAAETARISREQAVELANRAMNIALQVKAGEVAEAEQATNLKKADAVTAAQAVTTAEAVAVAKREKEVAVISAEQEAEKEASKKKIEAAAGVIIAQNNADAVKKTAEGAAAAAIEKARGESEAATLRATGAYAETFQPLKAKADGDLLQAAAEKALNDARNALSTEARQFQVDLKRVEITPEVVQSLVSAYAAIDNFNVTSISGAPGSTSGGIAVDGGTSGGSNVFDQFYAASRDNAVKATLLKKIITDLGGDPKITDNLPGLNGAASVAPVVTTPAPAPSA